MGKKPPYKGVLLTVTSQLPNTKNDLHHGNQEFTQRGNVLWGTKSKGACLFQSEVTVVNLTCDKMLIPVEHHYPRLKRQQMLSLAIGRILAK